MTGVEIAKTMIGLNEVKNNLIIKTYLKTEAIDGDISIDPAKISWCAAIMNAWERQAGNKGTGRLNAQSFLKYGAAVNFDDAEEGDIVVFHFPNEPAENGHVTYFISWNDDDNTVKCLGGNQSNSVCYSDYSQDYILDIRRSS